MEFRPLFKSNTSGTADLEFEKDCDFLKILYKSNRLPQNTIRVDFKKQVDAHTQGEKSLNEGTYKHANLYKLCEVTFLRKSRAMTCRYVAALYIFSVKGLNSYIPRSNQVK